MSSPPPTLDAVEEAPVWLEVNGAPAVTWMCTPAQLDELVVGWLHGEGYIESASDLVSLRPCAKELGFWAQVPPERYSDVETTDRRRVLASGCGAVTTILGSLSSLPRRTVTAPDLEADHRSESVLLLGSDSMTGVRRNARIVDLRHCGVRR